MQSDPQPNNNKSYKQKMREAVSNNSQKYEYEYFRDTEDRLKRYRKPKNLQTAGSNAGHIRIKFLQKYYIWWKRKSFDFKLAIMPWFLGFTGLFVIYQFSMIWSQNDLQRQIKSKLPFQMNNEVIQKMKQLRKQGKQQQFSQNQLRKKLKVKKQVN